jgi:multidrug resistance protein
MVGFGIVIPVLPVYARNEPFLLNPTQLGWLVGIFSLIQLIAAPFFGMLSDRIGRKPVLLFSVIGTAVGFFVIGRADAAWMLFLGRIIDGASGGNIATAQACIADVTAPEKRSRAMGVIGAAFGLGFIMGPALGGFLASYSHTAPFYFAGGLAVVNALLIWWRLPETYPAEARALDKQRASLGEVFADGRGVFITLLLVATLVSTTGFAFIHVLFALFCGDTFQWGLRETSYAFAYVGVLAVFVQGGLLRRLLKYNIEKQLAAIGALLLAMSLFWLPRVTGRLMGLMTSAGSFGRFLGPALAVLPLPLNFSTLMRPLSAEVLPGIQTGYITAFTGGAILVGVSFLCVLFLKVPTVSEPANQPASAAH